MKFLLNVYADHVVGDALSDVERDSMQDNADFVAAARESGELIDSQAVADPSTSAVVRATIPAARNDAIEVRPVMLATGMEM